MELLLGILILTIGPLLLVASACGFVGMAISKSKEAEMLGFILGFCFGPLGIIGACLVDGRPQCRSCGGRVASSASKCMHCGQSFTPPPLDPIQQRQRKVREAVAARPEPTELVFEEDVLPDVYKPPSKWDARRRRLERWWTDMDSGNRFLVKFWAATIVGFAATLSAVYFLNSPGS